MTDEPALLTAIRAHPGEDTPRLAYADWLDEHAGEVPGRNPQEVRDRAMLIRAQIEATRQPTGDPARGELEGAAAALLKKHRKAWEATQRALGASKITWTRGFPAAATISGADLLIHPDRLFEAAPITTLRVTAVSEAQLQALASCPHLANLTTLDLSQNPITNDGARALADSPHLTNLTGLNLSNSDIRDDGVQALMDSPYLLNLTSLDLSHNTLITDNSAWILAGSTSLRNLTSLDLSHTPIGNEAARRLIASAHLVKLTALNLSGSDIGPSVEQMVARTLAVRAGTGSPGPRP